ncbi:ankyrin repeat domain-containing protein [Acidobacteriota bacterium]
MKNQLFLIIIIVLLVILFGCSKTGSIHEAVKTGDIQLIEKILKKDPGLLNSLDADKMTPLHIAVDEGNIESASFLLSKGAEVNLANYKKETPLHIAANEGRAELTKLLLENDADPTLREMRDRIPLFLACNWGNDLETVRLLIDAGSDVNDRNAGGEILFTSTLYYGRKDIIDLLIDRGGVMPNDELSLSRILYVTASNGMERPFNMVVEKAQEHGLEWWRWVPILACARGGSIPIVEAFITKGHDYKEKGIHGVSPLHVAAESGRSALVEYLLDKGAEIDSPSLTGKTAFHYAKENNHDNLVNLLISRGAAQDPPRFPILQGEYLGQERPGDSPQMFAPGFVSDHGFSSEHSPAIFSPDLKEVYWTKKFRGPILYMKQVEGVWTAPQKAPFCSEYGDGEPIFSPDGSKLYFLSQRPVEEGGATDKENMWFMERTNDEWSEPKPVSPVINAFPLHWLFSISNEGTIYFASPKGGGFGSQDIYCSRLVDGEYEEPRNLGEVINGVGFDHTPFIAPDESYLLYVTSGETPSPEAMKFHISFKNEDGTWVEPIKLSDKINSFGGALCPYVTPDGKYMFFIGEGDIYWVDAGFIEKLRPKN